jgi:hypothetical protein
VTVSTVAQVSDDGVLYTPVNSCVLLESIKGLKGMAPDSGLTLQHRVPLFGVPARCDAR